MTDDTKPDYANDTLNFHFSENKRLFLENLELKKQLVEGPQQEKETIDIYLADTDAEKKAVLEELARQGRGFICHGRPPPQVLKK